MTKRKIILGEYLEFEKGISVPRDRLFITNNIAYLHYGDIYKIYNHVVDINKEIDNILKISTDEKYKKTQLLKDGDIVYNLTSESVDDLGKAVYIRNPNNISFVSGMETTIMRVTDKSILLPEYLNYILSTYKFKCLLRQYVTGMKVYRVHPRDIGRIEIEVPDINEQKKIIDILNPFNDKIELNNQMNQTLEEIASLLYKRWFVDFEFPDDKGNPYKSSGGEMVDSELGMIPKGWEVKKLGEIELIITDFVSNGSFASLKANTKIYKEENYAVFVRNTDLKSGKFETYVDEKTYQFLSKSKLLGGEIIISNVGDVGSVFLCPRINKKMTLGNNVILVKSQESKIYWNYYLYIFLKSSLGKALLESITSGSAQMKFNKTDFKKLKFIAPNFNTLEEFNKIFDKNIFLQNNYKAENTKLQTMKKELLKELI